MINGIATFVFKELNAAFLFRDTLIVAGFFIAVTGISVTNFDCRNLNRIVMLLLPVFNIQIVRLAEGYQWRLGGRSTLSLTTGIRALWFAIQRIDQLCSVRRFSV